MGVEHVGTEAHTKTLAARWQERQRWSFRICTICLKFSSCAWLSFIYYFVLLTSSIEIPQSVREFTGRTRAASPCVCGKEKMEN